MTRIGIIIGSTRPGRLGAQVAGWVHELAAQRSDAEFELIDLAEFRLPLFDQAVPPAMGGTGGPEAQAWVRTIESLDGFVFVTAEYNTQLPAALKNALDFVYAGWANKAAGIVSYGVVGGAGSAAQLRQLCGLLGLADVPAQVSLHLATDFENYTVFAPHESRTRSLHELLDRVVAWTAALEPMRAVRAASIA
jgi:NAD(P)H-dependent FMN reductase